MKKDLSLRGIIMTDEEITIDETEQYAKMENLIKKIKGEKGKGET